MITPCAASGAMTKPESAAATAIFPTSVFMIDLDGCLTSLASDERMAQLTQNLAEPIECAPFDVGFFAGREDFVPAETRRHLAGGCASRPPGGFTSLWR